jgi:hypothetical protein
VGLVDGLHDGANTVAARWGRSAHGSLIATNYPITGPVFSGPRLQPFVCQTEVFTLPDASKLGPPLDADCSVSRPGLVRPMDGRLQVRHIERFGTRQSASPQAEGSNRWLLRSVHAAALHRRRSIARSRKPPGSSKAWVPSRRRA